MRVLLVGDTHANGSWLERVVMVAAERHGADLIFQVGDFGWWPRLSTTDTFVRIARDSPVPLWWIDGNHEDHASLDVAVASDAARSAGGLVELGGNLRFVPRGTRVDIDGVSVVACGGAHSIDRRTRVDGVTWFDAEHVTDDDIDRCAEAGHADVLISHDAPAGWLIPNLPSDRGLPAPWQVELPTCELHRRQLARVMDAVTPQLVVHGHYHSFYRRHLDTGWGSVEVLGLSEDGSPHNLALLDCNKGRWRVEPIPIPAG